MAPTIDVNSLVLKYHDAAEFLRAYYDLRKSTHTAWSFQIWAKRLGQSKGVVVRNLTGTLAISEKMEKAYLKYFKLNAESTRYFQLIVAFGKLSKNYPDLNLRSSAMEHSRAIQFQMARPQFSSLEDAEFVARIEVGWLLNAFSGGGVKLEDCPAVLAKFHPGLCNIDFTALFHECRKRSLLTDRQGRIAFNPEALLYYMDARTTSRDAAILRYNQALNNYLNMLQTDTAREEYSRFQNRGCTIRIRPEHFQSIAQAMGEFMQKIIADYQDYSGDAVLDIQTFLAKTWETASTASPEPPTTNSNIGS